ncbi:hypothetical protein HD806DRAFT_522049 [Xylariaceae sp. AK1471]|nr:hypothetical protein HD806DRAFT_522049 [Xylariaceae sp. AK1471]
MAFTNSTYNFDGNGDGNYDQSILENLRDMVQRADPRGSYYLEPTWRINRLPIPQCNSPDLLQAASPTRPFENPARPRRSTFKERLRTLRSPELREIIMNASLKCLDTHKEVVKILKRMQHKRPRPITHGEHVRRPTVGLYLYCRTQRELVDIILELARQDRSGCFKQDVKDLIMVLEEKSHRARGLR